MQDGNRTRDTANTRQDTARQMAVANAIQCQEKQQLSNKATKQRTKVRKLIKRKRTEGRNKLKELIKEKANY